MPVSQNRSRNVVVRGQRTSLRLEPEVFEALDDLCEREGLTLNVLCNVLLDRHGDDTNLSSRLRVHALTYFRKLAGARSGLDRQLARRLSAAPASTPRAA